LLFLLFETLTREIQQEMQRGLLKNPYWKRAATLSVDRLLKNCYPERWDMMDTSEKEDLRKDFHEYKRQGSRYWQVAGVLGLGVLLGSGDTLAKVM
jgi:hypothetical protein